MYNSIGISFSLKISSILHEDKIWHVIQHSYLCYLTCLTTTLNSMGVISSNFIQLVKLNDSNVNVDGWLKKKTNKYTSPAAVFTELS